ncbi:MAG: FMN-binding protein, partial [Defluviitaleaceae bacterium]|nr:FMN-binding protein [Defluviitaleaceae bacterium]
MNIYKISTLLFGLLFLTACGSLSDPYSIWNQTREVEAPVQNVAVGQAMSFNPGTFEGVGEGGWYGNVYVSITVNEEGEISDVEVSHGETPEFAEHALETLIPATIRTNGVGLDVVAGATYTSNAFIAAVQNALENAGGTTVYYHWDTTVATSGSFNPGTYVGVGTGGWYGNVEVSVSIDDNGQIYLVYVVYSQET